MQQNAPKGTVAIGPPIDVWNRPDRVAAAATQIQTFQPSKNRALKAFATNPAAITGLAILTMVCAMAFLASVIFPQDPLSMVGTPFLWPGQEAAFPLGTDSLGRNVAAGIVHGARVSLIVGISATAIGLIIGVVIGALAGYFGGYIDDILVRIVELFQTIPHFLFLIVLVAIARPSIDTIIVGIGITSWPMIARLTRAEFRSLRERDFITSARASGFGNMRIIFKEILPNALPPIIVTSSIVLASAILNEGSLAFLGLGDANHISWGSMIGEGREHIRTAWFLIAVPGVSLVITVLAVNLLGEGLNDALNPRFSKDD